MTAAAQRLLDEALKLTAEERATLARGLLSSLSEEVSEEEADRAWGEEIGRRLARIESGEVQTVPWEEVRDRLRTEFGV